MSSQVPPSQPATTESARGRIRRPSEKVKAMIEDDAQAQRTSELQVQDKARRREVLARKREQASKAAETDPFMVSTLVPPRSHAASPVPVITDNAFSSRSLGNVHATNNGTCSGTLMTPLIVRKARVPPVTCALDTPLKTLNTKTLPTPGTAIQTPAQPPKSNKLQRLKSYFDISDATYGNEAIMLPSVRVPKRIYERDATPFLERLFDDAEKDDGNEPALPRKHTRYIMNVKVKDEPEPEPEPKPEPESEPLSLRSTVSADAAGGKTRVKAADYDVGTRCILQTAIEVYCALLLSNDPYAPHFKEVEWAKRAWNLSCRHHEVDRPYDGALLKLVTARTTHLRGQFKSKARSIVATVYGFEAGVDVSMIEKNRALFLTLKQDSSFVFYSRGPSLDLHKGIYMTPAIQQVINDVLFKNKSDDGVRLVDYYNPFPIAGFALAITAIECAINEWETGAREMIMFKEHEYSAVFRAHLTSLEEFRNVTKSINLLPRILQKIYDNGCAHAGVPIPDAKTKEMKKAIPNRAFMNALQDEFKLAETSRVAERYIEVSSDMDGEDVDMRNAEADEQDYLDMECGEGTRVEALAGAEMDFE